MAARTAAGRWPEAARRVLGEGEPRSREVGGRVAVHPGVDAVAVHVDRARHDELPGAGALRETGQLACLVGARAAGERVDDRLGTGPLGRAAGCEQRRAVAVEVLERGELGRLVRAGVGGHDVVTGGEQMRHGRPAYRSGAADEEHAHAVHGSATRRLHIGS
jgi:hypothetical protein